MAADSLVARRQAMPDGGSAWRSSIQAPHHHTDRDVGAASVGEGLLAAYAVTRDARYLRAARAAGDFLLGVAEPAAGGLRWPDWADPDGRRSDTHFTSFDDGAAGISDYLWRLSRGHARARFRAGALAGMRWLVAQAEGRRARRPRAPGAGRTIRTGACAHYGVGMGQAGIVLVLDAFADRTATRPSERTHARAPRGCGQLTANGARPLPRGSDRTRPTRPGSCPARREPRTCSSSATGATAIPPTSRRRAGCSRWVDDQGVVGLGGNGQLAVRRTTQVPGRPRASSSESPASRG